MPLGNTQEAIPFKKDSLNRIPARFVIRPDSKSILEPGPSDSSKPEVPPLFLHIPAHMNHCSSWLLEGISCPALSFFFFFFFSSSSSDGTGGGGRRGIWDAFTPRSRGLALYPPISKRKVQRGVLLGLSTFSLGQMFSY